MNTYREEAYELANHQMHVILLHHLISFSYIISLISFILFLSLEIFFHSLNEQEGRLRQMCNTN